MLRTLLIATVLCHASVPCIAYGASAQDGPQLYLNYLESADHPADFNPGWHEDAQGVTHDDDNWFFTQTEFVSEVSRIWKVPVGYDLAQDLAAQPLVVVRDVTSEILPYNHLGDTSYHQGYLAIPLQSPELPAALAIYRAHNLSLVGWVATRDSDGAWCAIDPNDGHAFTGSIVSPQQFLEYFIDWENIESGVQATHVATHDVKDENGASLALFGPQGGVVSPDGKYLYYSNGVAQSGPGYGIHVFDTTTWWRVAKSSPTGMFGLDWSAGWPDSEEPEGLCIWDLDDGRAPNISGQLHFILLDNDHTLGNDDDITFKHYTNKVFVHPGGAGEPFATVAAGAAAAFAGATLAVTGASYQEALTLDRWMLLTRNGGSGTVVIGE